MRFITVYFCRSNIADDLAHYASVDLTNCVKVRIIHIGIITLDGFTGSGEKILPLLSTIWTTLSNLTSTLSLLEDIVFVYRPIGNASETAAAELENFEIRMDEVHWASAEHIPELEGSHYWHRILCDRQRGREYFSQRTS